MTRKENNIKNIKSEEIKLVVFAIKEIVKRYPNNNKIYASLISTFFLSKRNEKIISNNFKDYVPFEKGRVYDVLDYLNELQILNLLVGAKGAKYLIFNDDKYTLYLHSLEKKEFSKEDLKIVLFAISKIKERYPNSKDKVYLSLVSTFFLTKRNEKILLDEFHKLPTFGKYGVYDILEQLEKINIIRIETGARGSRYLFINDGEYQAFLKSFVKKEITIDDLKAILFAIVSLRKQYPTSQGKVYLSLISVFFYSSYNKEKIEAALKTVPIYTREEILDIVYKLRDLSIVRVEDGDRGAKYIFLNDSNYLKFIEENTENYDKIDLKVILFALECLEKQYPNNKGNIYLSNLNTFFKDKRNNTLLIKKFSKTYHYNKDIILEMVDMLVTANIISKTIGPKGGIIIRLILKEKYNKENAIIKILETLNGKCSLSTLESIVFNKEKEISPYYVSAYYEHLDLFKNEDDFNSSISLLQGHKYISIEGNVIKLTYQGDETSL